MTRPQHSATESRSLDAVRRHRAELLQMIQAFEAALAVPARDPNWRERVGIRLGALRNAFGEHIVVTEGPDGLYAQLGEHAPRLARGVNVLSWEHSALLGSIDSLVQRVGSGDIERVRERASDLLRNLARHRQRGADLVYEAYATDIGGET